MKRIDLDNYARTRASKAPPFRILGGGDPYHLSPLQPPPPPRAPEPYKVGPLSSTSSRSHRRSSFVIIAETRPSTPTSSRSPSPVLNTGRVSPFRGRGFKGPPPHAQSRPESPVASVENRRRYGSNRRLSVSQQNSPKRSLIPQPTTRQRSTSLSKPKRQEPPPKTGRFIETKRNVARNQQNSKTSGVTNATTSSSTTTTTTATTVTGAARRGVIKPPGLSPIQGTPTKPIERTNPQGNRRFQAKDEKLRKTPSVRNRRNSLLPPKANSSKVRNASVGEKKSGGKEEPGGSPSKIPLKKGSSVNKSASTSSLVFSSSTNTNTTNSNTTTTTTKASKSNNKSVKGESKSKTDEKNPVGTTGEKEEKSNGSNSDDLGLIDLLKQSVTTSAVGTSSVVSTTTATAVQPLHIDASPVFPDKEGSNQQSPNSSKSQKEPNSDENSSGVRNGRESGQNRSDASKSSVQPEALDQKGHRVPPVPVEGQTGTEERNPGNEKPNGNDTGNKGHAKASGSISSQVASKKASEGVGEESNRESKNGSLPKEGVTTLGTKNESGRATESSNRSSASSKIGLASQKSSSQSLKNLKNAEVGKNASLASSTGSNESIRSTDTGVSLNTVKGVSSPREKRGMHLVKKSEEIETLSGNVTHLEHNGEPNVIPTAEEVRVPENLFTRWKNYIGRHCKCCPNAMRCLVCRRDPKGHQLWARNQTQNVSQIEAVAAPVVPDNGHPPGCWGKFKKACRCPRFREWKCCKRENRVAPAETTPCCPPERRCGAICSRLFSRCKCSRRNSNTEDANRRKSIRAKQSLTSVAAPPLSEVSAQQLIKSHGRETRAKIPEVLVEHNSLMRGAIPCLPVPLAWFCLVWNIFLPGTGTIWSGLFNLCTGQPRFSLVAGPRARLGAFIVNLIVGVGQAFTVLFCLVGWGWSIWWGVTMVRLARKYKRFRASEAANSDAEAGAGEPGAPLPPGVPSQALREMERAR